MKILAVDDDQEYLDYISDYLSDQGFEVHCAIDGTSMRNTLATQSIDLVLLDLSMPEEDGLALTRYLKQLSNIGIIILSGGTDAIDRILGIELGADDYINKRTEPRELVARIRAVLRRIKQPVNDPAAQLRPVRFHKWLMDLKSMSLKRADGTIVPTTTSEFEMLRAFVNNPNKVLNRDEMLSLLKGKDIAAHNRIIDVLVYRLRRIIEDNPENPEIIQTVHGKGYIFCADISFAEISPQNGIPNL
jgi:two-component system OmpR family response regulator